MAARGKYRIMVGMGFPFLTLGAATHLPTQIQLIVMTFVSPKFAPTFLVTSV